MLFEGYTIVGMPGGVLATVINVEFCFAFPKLSTINPVMFMTLPLVRFIVKFCDIWTEVPLTTNEKFLTGFPLMFMEIFADDTPAYAVILNVALTISNILGAVLLMLPLIEGIFVSKVIFHNEVAFISSIPSLTVTFKQ